VAARRISDQHYHVRRRARPGRPAGSYTLGSGPAETDRLRQQRAVLRAHSAALLDRVGLRPGDSAIDLGCGPGGILDLLSARVGPGGQVTGVDQDAGHVAAARAFTRERALGNVQIVHADARHPGLRYSPHPAVDRVTELLLTSYRHDSADPHLGRR